MILRLLFAGAAWGIVAYLLAAKAFGPVIWGGVLAAPLIGLPVGRALHPWFERVEGYRRGLVALASVYAGAIAFGLAVGLYDLVRGGTSRVALEVVLQAVLGTLWGATLFIIALWPLAYGTHWALERAGER